MTVNYKEKSIMEQADKLSYNFGIFRKHHF